MSRLTEREKMTNDDDVAWLSLGFSGWPPFSVFPLKQIASSSLSYSRFAERRCAIGGVGDQLLICVA